MQISYYTGLRIGEVCGLAWQDINLEEQYMVVRRSESYNKFGSRHELGATKSNKVRTVDFGDTLAGILKEAKKQQHRNRLKYGSLYHHNCYRTTTEKGREYHEVDTFPADGEVPVGYRKISLVCIKPDGSYTSKHYVHDVCKRLAKKVAGLEGFHFHMLRHTYTSNMLKGGTSPKDVQELLGHADVSTTMNIYAHTTRSEKKKSVMKLDKVVGDE